MKHILRRSIPVLALCTIVMAGAPQAAGAPKLSRGHRWVRNRPLTTMALTIVPRTFVPEQYKATCNTLLAWKAKSELLAKAAKVGLPWHLHIYPHRQGLTEKLKESLRKLYSTYPGCTGWMVWDEPKRTGMLTAAPTMAWLRKEYPDMLVYSNAYPMGAGAKRMYGGDPPGGRYSYADYLRDMVRIMKVDVLSFDVYIFREGGGTGNMFPTVATARKVALEAGIPYWAFVQTHGDPRRRYRMPSESDVRMQVFSMLAHGYTGILYFTYEDQQGPAMVDETGRRRPIYYHVARMSQEIVNVGKALRFLTSTDVRVALCNDNKVQSGLTAWAPGAGGENRIQGVTITDTKQADWKDVMLGFFKDDDGRNYLMVTNLWHGQGAAAADRKVTVRLRLDRSVRHVGRLSRETGAPELLVVRDGVLELTLPGGTGDLLSLDGARFPGLKTR